MKYIHEMRAYEKWAPFVARLIFGFQFLLGAAFKIIGHSMEVAQTAAVGVPFPELAVWLAFILELAAAIALIVGYRVRLVGFVLAIYVFALALIFYRNIGDMQTMGMFVSHLSMIAGLLYVSVYGAQSVTMKKDPLPAN
jgi:putative oxidoreductase